MAWRVFSGGAPSRSHRSPLAATPSFSGFSFSAIAGRFISGDEGHGPRQRPGYQVTPKLSLSCPMHAGNKTDLVQKTSPPEVKQAAYGETRTANIKKKLMKNKLSGEAAAPANAVQQSSTRAERVTKYNYNRELPTLKVLEFLRAQLPQQYELAEIVGKWIWLEFPKASNRAAANALHRLGFHWNQRRCVWQHPCGACAPFASHPQDPRSKYGSYFAADLKTA
ncbi:MAG TPA: hypothetical protein VH413_01730 [Verrucomicrobiae bacterium]|nr:hypothetical protein [Verrucomicrobiae bacterium]